MQSCLLFLNLGGGEIFLVVVVILLLFGGKGVPNIARTLGKSIREFKDATNGIQRDLQSHANDIKNEMGSHTRVVEEQVQQARQNWQAQTKEFEAEAETIKKDIEK
ncbi:MAG: twin-arginine translocase TatA/TatE family subunit [Bacteroidetes bacterium]|nr:twin-arginine translocase TatA/TatE family subunit [Bacteroidota bacterium]